MRKAIIPATAIVLACSACDWKDFRASIPVHYFDNKEIAKTFPELHDRAGFAMLADDSVYFDFDCSGDDICVQRYVDMEFWENHEYGHIVDKKLGFPEGATKIGMERSAQCVAEVVTKRGPNFTLPDDGYWDCPDQEVIRYRRLMVNAGILDDQRKQMEQENNA